MTTITSRNVNSFFPSQPLNMSVASAPSSASDGPQGPLQFADGFDAGGGAPAVDLGGNAAPPQAGLTSLRDGTYLLSTVDDELMQTQWTLRKQGGTLILDVQRQATPTDGVTTFSTLADSFRVNPDGTFASRIATPADSDGSYFMTTIGQLKVENGMLSLKASQNRGTDASVDSNMSDLQRAMLKTGNYPLSASTSLDPDAQAIPTVASQSWSVGDYDVSLRTLGDRHVLQVEPPADARGFSSAGPDGISVGVRPDGSLFNVSGSGPTLSGGINGDNLEFWVLGPMGQATSAMTRLPLPGISAILAGD
jgi:hypothetical protein